MIKLTIEGNFRTTFNMDSEEVNNLAKIVYCMGIHCANCRPRILVHVNVYTDETTDVVVLKS